MAALSDVGTVIETDVLVMGGGLAGLPAAIAARDRGVDVSVMDKGGIERSGAIAGGIDHFIAYLNQGEAWDTREGYLAYVGRVARGAVDLAIHEKVYCDFLADAIGLIEKRLGLSMTDGRTGTYYRTQSMGQPGPLWINFDGKNLKPALAKETRRVGCRVLPKVIATGLLTEGGRVVGAAGLHARTGEFHLVVAKAVIAATGNTNRLFRTQGGLPFNTWLCPYDTGDAQAHAFEVGAALTNMEYVRMTVVPKGFSAPGFNAFTGMGCRFINAKGEAFMERYHAQGDRAPRNVVANAVLAEFQAGRGPVYVDGRHLDPADLEHLAMTLQVDKDTLPDYLHQRRVDFSKELFEVGISEGMQAGPSEVAGSGIMIDERCAATVPGLFAVGDCADQIRCAHMAVTGGLAAGRHAAEYAKGLPASAPDVERAAALRRRTLAPLERRGGITAREVEDRIRDIMSDRVGPVRNAAGLRGAQSALDAVAPELDRIAARDNHEAMRAAETRSLHAIGRIMAAAALYREESRFVPFHSREDFPETDDRRWCGLVVCRPGASGGVDTGFKALRY
ncbi:MAG TPA: FAD-binding protein [Candidatus Methylomirabilis sp.]|jgi:adenylylsulfate reductase subunit A